MSVREDKADGGSSQQSLIPCIEDADEIWDIVTTRLPTTALILQEMEKVINDAQNILHNFQTIDYSHNQPRPNQLGSYIHNNSIISSQYDEASYTSDKKMMTELVQSSEVATITVNHHSCKTDSLEDCNQFHSEKVIGHSRPSSGASYHSSSTSSSSLSTIFHNAKSTSTLDQVDNERLTISDPLYEIIKINALDYDNMMKNYEITISSIKQATEIIKNVESTSPRMTLKDVMFSTLEPRTCSQIGDQPTISNLRELEIDIKLASDIESPRQSEPSSTLGKSSSIPRPIPNKFRGLNNKIYNLGISPIYNNKS